ncbi:hypothetical protein HY990_02145 [Candidatus Micrarchaeota archaeon]|nr:hypothetical protein [Candidatus Micrarchaeota archaeon]
MKALTKLMIIFVLAQILGFLTGITVLRDYSQNQFAQALSVTADSQDIGNVIFFIGYIIFSAVAMILLIRYLGKHKILFRAMEFFMISGSSSIAFYAMLRLVLGIDESTIGGIILGLILAAIKISKKLEVKNIAALMATAGVGVVFGISLGPIPMTIFLILLSIYDYIAVFKTKHMVEMANFVVEQDMAFTVTATTDEPQEDEMDKRIDLGTGDLIAPIMMGVAVLPISPIASILTFLGAIAAMIVFIYIVRKKKIVLPALPPIVAGMFMVLVFGKIAGLY